MKYELDVGDIKKAIVYWLCNSGETDIDDGTHDISLACHTLSSSEWSAVAEVTEKPDFQE